MRVICAWCKTEIGFRCPNCGDKLFPHPDDPRLMICRNPPTALVYAIEHMDTSHGICEECKRKFDPASALGTLAEPGLTDEDRANLIVQRTGKKERTP